MPTSSRLALARRIAAELRREEGTNLVGVGVYGSAARGTERAHSDLDLLVVVRAKRRAPRKTIRDGVLVTFHRLDMEEARAEVLEPHPGLPEALSGWRSLRPLHDPQGLLRRLKARAQDVPTAQWRVAARRALLEAYEDLGKLRNALESKDLEEAREMAIWFTNGAMSAVFCLEEHVVETDARIFAELRRRGALGAAICRLRHERLDLASTSRLAERIWPELLARSSRKGVPVADLS